MDNNKCLRYRYFEWSHLIDESPLKSFTSYFYWLWSYFVHKRCLGNNISLSLLLLLWISFIIDFLVFYLTMRLYYLVDMYIYTIFILHANMYVTLFIVFMSFDLLTCIYFIHDFQQTSYSKMLCMYLLHVILWDVLYKWCFVCTVLNPNVS